MSSPVSRRNLVRAGLAGAAGITGLAVAGQLAKKYNLIPPDHGGIYGVGETLTYASHRLLTSGHSMAREFSRAEISKIAPMNGQTPQNETYERLLTGGFADWRLTVDGLVARPASLSLSDLQRYPLSTQVTQLACEEGWSYIAEWSGVALSQILKAVGVLPQAKYVVYFSIDPGWWDSIDMADAWHPQTLLTYGMNGAPLTKDFGAPMRLRLPRQLGYKSVKYLARLTVTDNLKSFGKGLGSSPPEFGFSWYAGI
jgi:DMSO/TMAO reductase YedYZ molybdopterin-dependent catalytic subunit